MPNSSVKNEKMCEDLPREGRKRAKELGLSGYSAMTKDKLDSALRNH